MHEGVIISKDAPAAIGPYVQARMTGSLVFCSGQIPLDPKTMNLVEGGIVPQTERVIQNIKAVLAAAGLGLKNVIKASVFLVDMTDFSAFNEVYARFFSEPYPARTTVAVAALPKGARVEIEVIAQKS